MGQTIAAKSVQTHVCKNKSCSGYLTLRSLSLGLIPQVTKMQ